MDAMGASGVRLDLPLALDQVIPAVDAKGRAERLCPKCGIVKDSTSEYFPSRAAKSGRRLLTSWCRACHGASRDDLGKMKNRLRRYGMTPEQFAEMASSGACPICGAGYVWERHHRSQPVVDHDHATGKVRGVVCRTCNLGLGYTKDDPRLAAEFAYYLTYGLAPRNISVHSR